jgi:hypothetical protein
MASEYSALAALSNITRLSACRYRPAAGYLTSKLKFGRVTGLGSN